MDDDRDENSQTGPEEYGIGKNHASGPKLIKKATWQRGFMVLERYVGMFIFVGGIRGLIDTEFAMEISFDLKQSLEQLEGDLWGNPPVGSTGLVKNCHSYRQIPLVELKVEEMRTLIGQNIGLNFLVPLAVQELQGNILMEGDFYEGDLLVAVLNSETVFWKENFEFWTCLCAIIEGNEKLLIEFDTTDEIRDSWMDGIRDFRAIHD